MCFKSKDNHELCQKDNKELLNDNYKTSILSDEKDEDKEFYQDLLMEQQEQM